MKSNVAHVVYRQLLCQSGHGYPLWTPEPDQSLPHAFKQRGISVGDVGILTERGGFDFLFNIHEGANGGVNENQVPPGFKPLSLETRDTSVYPFIHKERGSVISSSVSRKSIAFDAEAEVGFVAGGGFGFEFSTDSDRAAVLVLPHGATGYDAKHRARYAEYAVTNAKAWYAYANGTLGCGAANGTIYLVTGCDKARSWATAAVSQASQTRSVSLEFLAGGLAGSAISFQSSWSHDFGAETRIFPPSAGSPTLDEVHCVFTRGYAVAVRQNFLGRAIRGAVHVSSDPGSTFPKAPTPYWPPPPGSRDNTGARPAPSPSAQDTDAGLSDQSTRSPVPVSSYPGNAVTSSKAPQTHLLPHMRSGYIAHDEHNSSESTQGIDSATSTSTWNNRTESSPVPNFLPPAPQSGYSNDTDCDSSNMGGTQRFSSALPGELCNPSSVICTSILKHHEDLEVAITHDDDWTSLFRSPFQIPLYSPQWEYFLARVVDRPGVVSRNTLVICEDDPWCCLARSWSTFNKRLLAQASYSVISPRLNYPKIEKYVHPIIIAEVFALYYQCINPFMHLHDEDFHTPEKLSQDCPFLYSVIFAISCCYHPSVNWLWMYRTSMRIVRSYVDSQIEEEEKSVGVCQAYILMSGYVRGPSWLYADRAIRIAIDLDLHLTSPLLGTETAENQREQLNRDRTWQICLNLDRSMATQFGRPITIRKDANWDYADWYKRSQYNTAYDVYICGYTILLQIATRFLDEVMAKTREHHGNMNEVDFDKITYPYAQELEAFKVEWEARFDPFKEEPNMNMLFKLLLLCLAYSRLLMFSFGLQQSYAKGIDETDKTLVQKCVENAQEVHDLTFQLSGSQFVGWRYSPQAYMSLHICAGTFLLKLSCPKYFSDSPTMPSLLDELVEEKISFDLAENTLIEDEMETDVRQTPRHYCIMLQELTLCVRPPKDSSYERVPNTPLGLGGSTDGTDPNLWAVLVDPVWWETLMLPGFRWVVEGGELGGGFIASPPELAKKHKLLRMKRRR